MISSSATVEPMLKSLNSLQLHLVTTEFVYGLTNGSSFLVKIGGNFPKRAMELSGAIGICIGPSSISRWNEEELNLAVAIRQQQPGIMPIPILLPGASVTNLPPSLKKEVTIDFQEGIHSPLALKRLIAATLREETSSRSLT